MTTLPPPPLSGLPVDAPIGIFDSGVGGLTVARAVLDQLPHENIVYIGDTAHGPYGPLPIAKVRAHALGVMDELVDAGVKALVIACNSASAAVLRDARERYTRRRGIPVVEVIQPAVRRAVAATRNGKIGVIATEATVSSRAYEDTFAAAPHLEITSAACPRFVEFVERGITASAELLAVAEEYTAALRQAEVDTLVLGCTHYPLLTGVLSYVMGDAVTLVSSAEETAKDLFRALTQESLLRDPAGESPAAAQLSGEGASVGSLQSSASANTFLATGDAQSFQRLARRFLGPEVAAVEHIAHVTERYPTGLIPRVNAPAVAGPSGGRDDDAPQAQHPGGTPPEHRTRDEGLSHPRWN
ncbi:glutamate racemase [Nesterenkonia aerolata]|uniref:Glutamate racemase n=1 Tax=Nesterenkonia aerolata TaxID=3074079 RepID=A0ABU2DSQ4_9MICC|nr:glutamate racemase [Nesterenkonia sp. LY-0111]MDR8019533.1 glutamate racemase [Nesterenkonia sp. LY-0111]